MRPGLRDDRGMAVVELALVAPVLLVFMFLVVFAGRVAAADADVRRAASEAARAASMRQEPSEAIDAARSTAQTNLSRSGVTCVELEVNVDVGELQAGGRVAVNVRCTASMRDVTFVGVPGTREFSARAVEVVDTYRGGGP